MANLVPTSRRMVGALRHGQYGAVLEEQTGWISIATLAVLLQVGEDVIQQILQADRTDRRSRFETENRADGLYVRAKRGWSLSSGVTLEGAMNPVLWNALPDFLFHATLLENQQSIITNGLLCGTGLQRIGGRDRSHVHWSERYAFGEGTRSQDKQNDPCRRSSQGFASTRSEHVRGTVTASWSGCSGVD